MIVAIECNEIVKVAGQSYVKHKPVKVNILNEKLIRSKYFELELKQFLAPIPQSLIDIKNVNINTTLIRFADATKLEVDNNIKAAYYEYFGSKGSAVTRSKRMVPVLPVVVGVIGVLTVIDLAVMILEAKIIKDLKGELNDAKKNLMEVMKTVNELNQNLVELEYVTKMKFDLSSFYNNVEKITLNFMKLLIKKKPVILSSIPNHMSTYFEKAGIESDLNEIVFLRLEKFSAESIIIEIKVADTEVTSTIECNIYDHFGFFQNHIFSKYLMNDSPICYPSNVTCSSLESSKCLTDENETIMNCTSSGFHPCKCEPHDVTGCGKYEELAGTDWIRTEQNQNFVVVATTSKTFSFKTPVVTTTKMVPPSGIFAIIIHENEEMKIGGHVILGYSPKATKILHIFNHTFMAPPVPTAKVIEYKHYELTSVNTTSVIFYKIMNRALRTEELVYSPNTAYADIPDAIHSPVLPDAVYSPYFVPDIVKQAESAEVSSSNDESSIIYLIIPLLLVLMALVIAAVFFFIKKKKMMHTKDVPTNVKIIYPSIKSDVFNTAPYKHHELAPTVTPTAPVEECLPVKTSVGESSQNLGQVPQETAQLPQYSAQRPSTPNSQRPIFPQNPRAVHYTQRNQNAFYYPQQQPYSPLFLQQHPNVVSYAPPTPNAALFANQLPNQTPQFSSSSSNPFPTSTPQRPPSSSQSKRKRTTSPEIEYLTENHDLWFVIQSDDNNNYCVDVNNSAAFFASHDPLETRKNYEPNKTLSFFDEGGNELHGTILFKGTYAQCNYHIHQLPSFNLTEMPPNDDFLANNENGSQMETADLRDIDSLTIAVRNLNVKLENFKLDIKADLSKLNTRILKLEAKKVSNKAQPTKTELKTLVDGIQREIKLIDDPHAFILQKITDFRARSSPIICGGRGDIRTMLYANQGYFIENFDNANACGGAVLKILVGPVMAKEAFLPNAHYEKGPHRRHGQMKKVYSFAVTSAFYLSLDLLIANIFVPDHRKIFHGKARTYINQNVDTLAFHRGRTGKEHVVQPYEDGEWVFTREEALMDDFNAEKASNQDNIVGTYSWIINLGMESAVGNEYQPATSSTVEREEDF
uniref:Uncharacterized protein n=1 Tax=Panagrolaimus sp. PS1159 TaxID=55785 RepID=A0AC35G8Q6_9BILA